MDRTRIRAAQRELYEAGEYAALSETLRPAAVDLVEVAGVAPGHRVLDVGTGDGNAAVEAAAVAALVVGCDLSVVQVARARLRDPRCRWLAADAERLPFADSSFDAVLSCFGAVFAPDPEQATAELFRVARPVGVVVVTSWPDDGLMAELTAAVRAASASPASFPDQDLGWGSADTARARFEAHSSSVTVLRRTLHLDPAVRGSAGERDCVARYLAAHVAPADLDEARVAVSGRYRRSDGLLRCDYLVVVARAAR